MFNVVRISRDCGSTGGKIVEIPARRWADFAHRFYGKDWNGHCLYYLVT